MQSFSRYRDVIVVVWPWSVHLNAPVLYGNEVKDFWLILFTYSATQSFASYTSRYRIRSGCVNNNKSGVSKPRANTTRIQVQQRTPLSDQWARLEQVQFNYLRRDGNWQTQTREIYHRGHGAAVLLFNRDKGTIVLTRQFRFPAWEEGDDGFMLEVPAGIIESDDPFDTVRRETEEETGFIIDQPDFLFRAYCSPGSVTEQIHYFSANYESNRRVGAGGGLLQEGEDIEVLEVELTEAVQWISSGQIIDAKTILLILYAQIHIL